MVVIDASVVVRWFVHGTGSEAAVSWIDRDDLAAPELIIAEVGNALWRYVRHGDLLEDEASDVLRHTPGRFLTLAPSAELAPRALQIATARDHPLYDCLHIALAEREACRLVSLDRRLIALAREAGVDGILLP